MNLTFLSAAAVAGMVTPDVDPASDVNVAAFLDAETLVVGQAYEFEVFLELPGGDVEASSAFLQLDVPPSVKLVGRVISDHRELARNDFLNEPFERYLKETPARIGFELVAEPKPGETIGLNLIAYIRPGGDEKPFFLRRRLELLVEAGADAVEEDARSDWGTDEGLLQLGAEAAAFELPRGDGSTLRLEDLIGEKNIIVTTYRAHW